MANEVSWRAINPVSTAQFKPRCGFEGEKITDTGLEVHPKISTRQD